MKNYRVSPVVAAMVAMMANPGSINMMRPRPKKEALPKQLTALDMDRLKKAQEKRDRKRTRRLNK